MFFSKMFSLFLSPKTPKIKGFGNYLVYLALSILRFCEKCQPYYQPYQYMAICQKIFRKLMKEYLDSLFYLFYIESVAQCKNV